MPDQTRAPVRGRPARPAGSHAAGALPGGPGGPDAAGAAAPGVPPGNPSSTAPGTAPGTTPSTAPSTTPSTAPRWPRRPQLQPGLQRLWRDPETLQLGHTPGRALVLVGLDPPTRDALALFDGTRDLDALQRDAETRGCPQERTAALVDLLADAGLLQDAAEAAGPVSRLPREERDRMAPDVAALGLLTRGRPGPALERRSQARVHVAGAGRVGAPLAAALAAAGVGSVDVVDGATARAQDAGPGGLHPSDAGRSRGEAARQRVQDLAPSADPRPVLLPDLVVLAPVAGLVPREAAALVRQGVPHLLAEVREQVGVVGPLVLPGRSACLHCLDLRRSDRDPDWPTLAAQLAGGRTVSACDSVLALAVAAQAALQVLTLLDETAATAVVDGTLELVLPDWRWRRRSWSAHPSCDCRAS